MHYLRIIALIAIHGAISSAFAQATAPLQELPASSATPLTAPSSNESAAIDSGPNAATRDGSPVANSAPLVAVASSATPVVEAGIGAADGNADEPVALGEPVIGSPIDTEADALPILFGPNAADLGLPPGTVLPAVTEITPVPPTTPAFANVWERIRSGFKMPDIDDELVRKWEAFYAARPEYWQRINERGSRYLYFITAEIERRGMPLEIALLPIIESAYNPEALSRARASGIWQFVPATGKSYGLQQNWWVDNRRDVTVATGSALDYLERLYAMFGDWQLALASYNWGEGSVQRAVNKNLAAHLKGDYASLKMPAETRNYLPKLQAVKNLVMAPEKFGLTLPSVADRPYFATVTITRQMDVALAARLAKMPLEDFKILNPAHNRPVMVGEGEQSITLPYDKTEVFVSNLSSYALPLLSWRPYQIKSGERLEHVAPRFGIDIDELKRVNGLTGRKRISPGHALLVPARGGDTPVDRIPMAMFKEAPNDGPGWHRVRRGESLVKIGARYGVTPADLKRLNGLPDFAVAPGHQLRLHDGVTVASRSGKSVVKSKRSSAKKQVVKVKRKR